MLVPTKMIISVHDHRTTENAPTDQLHQNRVFALCIDDRTYFLNKPVGGMNFLIKNDSNRTTQKSQNNEKNKEKFNKKQNKQ